MKKLHITTIFIVLFGASLFSQDIHFTQFYMSPLNLNPAMTGLMECNTRLVANYRNQWAGAIQSDAYNTYSVSYDQKIAVGRTDYFGIGGSLWGDVAGATRFGTTTGRISFSYSKKMGGYRKKAHYLVFGADAGISQRRININDLRWPSQHDGNGGWDGTNIPPEQNLITDQDFLFADLTAGLVWFSLLDYGNSFWIGLASHHLNRPNVSFLGDVVSLYSRNTIHAGGNFELKPGMSVVPGAIAMFQGPHVEFNVGTSLRFDMGSGRTRGDSQSWQVGLWYRLGNKVEGGVHSDAIILMTRLDYQYYGIGFSYDYNISKLRNSAAANGAFEFSLVYYICGPEKRSVYCPRF